MQMSVFGALNTLVFLSTIIFTCFIIVDIESYTTNFDCYEAMSIINYSDFESFDCAEKYTETANTIGDLISVSSCSLEATRYVWEE